MKTTVNPLIAAAVIAVVVALGVFFYVRATRPPGGAASANGQGYQTPNYQDVYSKKGQTPSAPASGQ